MKKYLNYVERNLKTCRLRKAAAFIALICILGFVGSPTIQASGSTKQIGQNGPEIKVTGTVVDERGESIIGASVKLKSNAKVGTITDVDGTFVLTVPSDGVLVVSYIGFISMDIPVNGQS